MFIAAIPQLLLDVAAFLGAIVAILTAIGILTKLRPVKWLFNQLIGKPLAETFQRECREAVQPLIDELEVQMYKLKSEKVNIRLNEICDWQKGHDNKDQERFDLMTLRIENLENILEDHIEWEKEKYEEG